MIVIYNPRSYPSIPLLLEALHNEDVEATLSGSWHEGDKVINWGYNSRAPGAINKGIVGNKLTELKKMRDAGVRVINFDEQPHWRAQDWYPRQLRHCGGRDFIRGVRRRDVGYWVQKADVAKEFRVHVIGGKVVKVGMKVPKEGAHPHPWVRSLRYGWRPTYTREVRDLCPNNVRAIAKKAVAALGYDFGAVDVGVLRESNLPVVFEVNSAPGLKPSIAAVYARHLKEMVS